MKKIIVLMAAVLLSPVIHAKSFFDDTIFGVAFISQSVNIEVTGTTTGTTTEDGAGIGLYLDKYDKRKYRYNGTWSYVAYDDFDISSLTASADYLLPVNSSVTFFGGATLGGAMQTYSDASISDSGVGFLYGVQLGGIAYINKNLMMELGYRFRPTSIETDIVSSPGTTATVDELTEAYLSILLMF